LHNPGSQAVTVNILQGASYLSQPDAPFKELASLIPNDLGTVLGCGAHLVGLRRTKSGRFTLRDAIPMRKLREAFEAGNWYQYLIPAAEALSDWPAVEVTHEQVEALRHGNRIPAAPDSPERGRGISEAGELVALLVLNAETQEWQPKKVFFS